MFFFTLPVDSIDTRAQRDQGILVSSFVPSRHWRRERDIVLASEAEQVYGCHRTDSNLRQHPAADDERVQSISNDRLSRFGLTGSRIHDKNRALALVAAT